MVEDLKKSAEAVVHVATSPNLEGVTGKYFDKKNLVRSSQASYDEDVARRLWKISAEMTKLTTIVSTEPSYK